MYFDSFLAKEDFDQEERIGEKVHPRLWENLFTVNSSVEQGIINWLPFLVVS